MLHDRTFASYADDLAQLADSLGVRQFFVVGVSGGGPYAYAAVALLPERVQGVMTISTLAQAGNGCKLHHPCSSVLPHDGQFSPDSQLSYDTQSHNTWTGRPRLCESAWDSEHVQLQLPRKLLAGLVQSHQVAILSDRHLNQWQAPAGKMNAQEELEFFGEMDRVGEIVGRLFRRHSFVSRTLRDLALTNWGGRLLYSVLLQPVASNCLSLMAEVDR